MTELMGGHATLSSALGASGPSMIWIMLVSFGLTMSVVYGLVWLRQRKAWENLMFSLLSLSIASMNAIEIALMHAETTQSCAILLRWMHVPVLFTFIFSIGFIHFHLRTGRLWLAGTALSLRLIALALNLVQPASINFKTIFALKPIIFLGHRVMVPAGEPNPLMLLGLISLFLLAVYAIDASVSCWKKGERRRAVTAGGSLAAGIFLFTSYVVLIFWGLIEVPVVAGAFFMGVVTVMAYELSRDIFRSMQLGRDLLRERAITRAVYDGAPGLFYLMSQDMRFVIWNKRVAEVTGYSDAEIKDMIGPDFFESSDAAVMMNEWQRTMNHEVTRIEINLRCKDGSLRPYLLNAIRTDIDGQPHVVGMGFDLTSTREMEATLRQKERELAHLNRAATLGVMAASIAHELNQPLAAVNGNAEAARHYLASDQPNLKELREIIADIIGATSRASNVVKGLRALMRNTPHRDEPVNMNDVVESVLQLAYGETTIRKVKIEKSLEGNLAPIFGDHVQLQQVLLNLLLNALDALESVPPPERRISIRTESVDGSRIRLTVRDNGPGIPPEDIKDLFTPFFTRKQEGMGMGLPICRSIIEYHNGTLTAYNAPERGAVFEVVFPSMGV